MKEVQLSPKSQPSYTLEAECITPHNFTGKSIEKISQLKVYYGNVSAPLEEFFEVSGESAEDAGELRIVIKGSVKRTKRIGQGMEGGEILIQGDAGMYVGALMKGGKITVEGDAGDFSGMNMRGGELYIRGNAGSYLGGTYRGDRLGMKGGSIVVEGNAGIETGQFLNGGRIAVRGDAGIFTGVHMKKGVIVVEGEAGERAGAQMIGGTLVAKKGIGSLLPSFDFQGKEEKIELQDETIEGSFKKYTGDHAEKGARGEMYVGSG